MVKGGFARVKVLSNASHQPVSGARVFEVSGGYPASDIALSPASRGRLIENFGASAETGADGVAELGLLPGSWSLVVAKQGWRAARIQVNLQPGQTVNQEVALDRVWPLEGVVRDLAGRPVADAEVFALNNFGPDKSTVTDEAGHYELNYMEPGFGGDTTNPVLAALSQRPHWLLARQAEKNLIAVHTFDAKTSSLDLRLEPGVTIAATVLDADGSPVPHVTGNLRAISSNFTWEIVVPFDATGHARLGAVFPADSYSLFLRSPGFGSVTKELRPPAEPTDYLEFPPIVLPKASLGLAGVVLGPDGKPVTGAEVQVSEGNGQPGARAHTDAEGNFSFNAVAEGPTRLLVMFTSAGGRLVMLTAEARGGDTHVVIRIPINAPNTAKQSDVISTSGTVVDPANMPVAGARVYLATRASTGDWVTTDAEGKYTVIWQKDGNLPYQSYSLFVFDELRHLVGVSGLAPSTSKLDMRLGPALTVSTKALDPQGKPIAFATATVSASGAISYPPEITSAFANHEGNIQFGNLLQGYRYSISVGAKGYGVASIEAPYADAALTNLVLADVTLRASDRAIAGKVVDSQGNPLEGVGLTTQGEGQPRLEGRADRTAGIRSTACAKAKLS